MATRGRKRRGSSGGELGLELWSAEKVKALRALYLLIRLSQGRVLPAPFWTRINDLPANLEVRLKDADAKFDALDEFFKDKVRCKFQLRDDDPDRPPEFRSEPAIEWPLPPFVRKPITGPKSIDTHKLGDYSERTEAEYNSAGVQVLIIRWAMFVKHETQRTQENASAFTLILNDEWWQGVPEKDIAVAKEVMRAVDDNKSQPPELRKIAWDEKSPYMPPLRYLTAAAYTPAAAEKHKSVIGLFDHLPILDLSYIVIMPQVRGKGIGGRFIYRMQLECMRTSAPGILANHVHLPLANLLMSKFSNWHDYKFNRDRDGRARRPMKECFPEQIGDRVSMPAWHLCWATPAATLFATLHGRFAGQEAMATVLEGEVSPMANALQDWLASYRGKTEGAPAHDLAFEWEGGLITETVVCLRPLTDLSKSFDTDGVEKYIRDGNMTRSTSWQQLGDGPRKWLAQPSLVIVVEKWSTNFAQSDRDYVDGALVAFLINLGNALWCPVWVGEEAYPAKRVEDLVRKMQEPEETSGFRYDTDSYLHPYWVPGACPVPNPIISDQGRLLLPQLPARTGEGELYPMVDGVYEGIQVPEPSHTYLFSRTPATGERRDGQPPAPKKRRFSQMACAVCEGPAVVALEGVHLCDSCYT